MGLICPILLAGQFTLQPKQIDSENKGIIYNNEWSAEFKLHTNGYGIGFNWGEIKTYYKTQFYSINLDIIKHPREYRQNLRPTYYNAQTRPFVYGKQNAFSKAPLAIKSIFLRKHKEKAWRLVSLIKVAWLSVF